MAIENGLLETCNELGVKVLSFAFALGFLTGKYDTNTRPSGGPGSNIASNYLMARMVNH